MQTFSVWAARMACALASLALVSCVNLRTTYLADGSKGYAVSCKGFLSSWESCLVKAGRICGPRGYDTVEGDRYDRTMLIGCKSPQTASK